MRRNRLLVTSQELRHATISRDTIRSLLGQYSMDCIPDRLTENTGDSVVAQKIWEIWAT